MKKVKEANQKFEAQQDKYSELINIDFYEPFHELISAWESGFADACGLHPDGFSWFTTENNFGDKQHKCQALGKKEVKIKNAGDFWDFEMNK